MNVFTKIANKITDFFTEGYLLLGFISLVLVFALSICLILGVGLFVANRISPKLTSTLDEKVTITTFNSLMNHRRYRAATLLLEEKGNVVNSSSDQAILYSELGECYKNIGDYTKAKQCYLKVLDYAAKYFEDPDREAVSIQKGLTLWQINYDLYSIARITSDYREQKHYCEVMSDLLRDGLESAEGYSVLNLLSRIANCEVTHYDNPGIAIEEMRSIITTDNTAYKNSVLLLRNLATLVDWEIEDGDTESAQKHLDSACRLAAIVPSEELMDSFGQLSRSCYRLGDQDRGNILLRLYSKRLQHSLGSSSLESQASAISLMRFQEDKINWDSFLKRLDKQCSLIRESVQNSIVGMTEEQREYVASILDEPFSYVLDLLSRHNDEYLAGICYKNHLFRKGLLLSSNTSERNSAYNTQDKEIIDKYESLMSKRKLLLAYSESPIPTDRSKLKSIKDDITQLEDELSSVLWKEREKQIIPDITELGRAVPHGVILDYIEDNDNVYVFTIKRDNNYRDRVGSSELTFSRLCSKVELNEILASDDINDIYRSGKLSKLVLPDLEIDKIKDIVYSPSASVNRIAFCALKDKSERYLTDRHNIRLVSSASSLLNEVREESYTGRDASLWGGIDYSTDQVRLKNQIAHRGITRGDTLSFLPFSNIEIEAICSSLSNTMGSIDVFKGIDATEDSFRELSGKTSYLIHISTHGFFSENAKNSVANNPLHNAGLFFSGANDAWTNEACKEDSDNDGIMRASDIALMNLSNCHLAVLSACETGLATASNGDGIFGLQRAFKLAGADKVIMSLWSVSDYHTSELMEFFYDSISEGEETNQAFDIAVRHMRENYPNAPEYWAGFVLLD